jgi:hypothetical protein
MLIFCKCILVHKYICENFLYPYQQVHVFVRVIMLKLARHALESGDYLIRINGVMPIRGLVCPRIHNQI